MSDLIAQANSMDTRNLLDLYNKKKEQQKSDPNDVRAKSIEAIKYVLKSRGEKV